MGTSCILALGSFMAMVAACQLIAGAVNGDWMHTSQIIAHVPSDTADLPRWELEQVEAAFDEAADVIQGWGMPAGFHSVLTKSDDIQDDDGGAIPIGGARVTTEYGLWKACVWTKVINAVNAEPDQKLRCRSYTELIKSGRISDDSPGELAPTPSSANFAAAQVLGVMGAVASGLALLLLAAVTIIVGNQGGSGLPSEGEEEEEELDAYEEPLGTCCANRGPRFPSTGWAGRLVLGGGLLVVLSVLSSLGALAAWADSEAAQDLSSRPEASNHKIAFAFGSSFVVVGLGAACNVAAIGILAAGFCWFKDKPARSAGGGPGLLKAGPGGASADYVEAPGGTLADFEACLPGPDDDDAKASL